MPTEYRDGEVFGGADGRPARITAAVLSESRDGAPQLVVYADLAGRLKNPRNPDEGYEGVPTSRQALYFFLRRGGAEHVRMRRRASLDTLSRILGGWLADDEETLRRLSPEHPASLVPELLTKAVYFQAHTYAGGAVYFTAAFPRAEVEVGREAA